jgi:cell division protein FtsI (penicillin-binding protein 3)
MLQVQFFKRIAQKIFTDVPSTNEIKNINKKISKEDNYNKYFYYKMQSKVKGCQMKGMPAMDAIALLENLNLKVSRMVKSSHNRYKQGENIVKNTTITLNYCEDKDILVKVKNESIKGSIMLLEN